MANDKKIDLKSLIEGRKSPLDIDQGGLGSILGGGQKSLVPSELSGAAGLAALVILDEKEAEAMRRLHMRVFHDIRSVLAGGMAIKITRSNSSLADAGSGRSFRDEELEFMYRIGLFSNYEILQLGLPFFEEEVSNFLAIPGDDENPHDPTTTDNMPRLECVKDMIRRHTGDELQGEALDAQAKDIFVVLSAMGEADIDKVKQKIQKEELTLDEMQELSTTEIKTPLDLLSGISAMMFGKAQMLTLLTDVVQGCEEFITLAKQEPSRAMVYHGDALSLIRDLMPSLDENLKDFAEEFGDTTTVNANKGVVDEVVKDPAKALDIVANKPDFDSAIIGRMKGLSVIYAGIISDYGVKKNLDKIKEMAVIDDENKALKLPATMIGMVKTPKRKKIDEDIKSRLVGSAAIQILYSLSQRATDGVSESVAVQEVAEGFSGLEGKELLTHGFTGLSSLSCLYGRLDRFIGSAGVIKQYLTVVKGEYEEQVRKEKAAEALAPKKPAVFGADREKADERKNTAEYLDAALRLATSLHERFSYVQKEVKSVYEDGKGNVDMQDLALINLAFICEDMRFVEKCMGRRQDKFEAMQTGRPGKK